MRALQINVRLVHDVDRIGYIFDAGFTFDASPMRIDGVMAHVETLADGCEQACAILVCMISVLASIVHAPYFSARLRLP